VTCGGPSGARRDARIREALPLVARGRTGKSSKSVRKLTRALGPVRELDVALMNLGCCATPATSEAAIARLRQLIEEQQRLGAEMVVSSRTSTWRNCRKGR
jgi:CHAD domain-containing protein